MRQPLVSVIIPCYNQGEYIQECLDSVMAQTYQDFEIIVIDDGSTDIQTQKILKTLKYPKTKLIFQKNMGVCIARNNAIKKAKGKYILPLDADDKIAPTFLSKTVAVLDKEKDVGIVSTWTQYFQNRTDIIDLDYNFPKILYFSPLQNACLFKKSDFEKIGGYNPNMVYGNEDWDFWLSIIELGKKVYRIKEALFFYRSHGISRSFSCQKDTFLLMNKQMVENHQDLYSKYPECRCKLLGIRTRKEKALRFLSKIICCFIPIKSWRKSIRRMYK